MPPSTFASFRATAFVPALLLAVAAACGGRKESKVTIETAPVERRDIVVNASATGVVEPVTVVEIKSKASGQVTSMPVDVGSQVSAGQLLVQIDTRDVKNQYDQAVAALRAAQARLDVSAAQKKRSDDLFAQEVITAQEHETAALDYANAQAAAVKARTDADIARVRLEDATVRAPVAGTIIEKPVSLGQVITSATSSASGGTTILKMADLSKVRVRALVNETDIGQVQPGQTASVNVDAFPDRRFRGTVEKVEPQAVVQQSVTMFPVLVTLDNREGFLKPGMNGEVSVLVERRENVLAVVNDAVRNPNEAAQAAQALGLDPDSVRAQIRAQRGVGSAPGGPGASPVGATPTRTVAGGDVERASGQRANGQRRAGGRRGGAQGQPPADTANGARIQLRQAPETSPGAEQQSAIRQGLVFVKDSAEGYQPRMVRLGVSNYDFTEVLSGLDEGEEVALLSAAALQMRRQEMNDRMRGMSGVPGMQRQGTGGTTGGAGGSQRGGGR